MEVVESSDESDSDSDEKGDVSAIFCSILQVLSVIPCVLVGKIACCQPTVHNSLWIVCLVVVLRHVIYTEQVFLYWL